MKTRKMPKRILAFLLALVMLTATPGIIPHAFAAGGYLTSLMLSESMGAADVLQGNFDSGTDEYTIYTKMGTFVFEYSAASADVSFEFFADNSSTAEFGMALGPYVIFYPNWSTHEKYTVVITVSPTDGVGEEHSYTVDIIYPNFKHLISFSIGSAGGTVFSGFDPADTENFSYDSIFVGSGISELYLEMYIAAGARLKISSDNTTDIGINNGYEYTNQSNYATAKLKNNPDPYTAGKTVFTIDVTSAEGALRTYTFTVTRAAERPPEDARLRSIGDIAVCPESYPGETESLTLSPAFAGDTHSYTAQPEFECDYDTLAFAVVPKAERDGFSAYGGTVEVFDSDGNRCTGVRTDISVSESGFSVDLDKYSFSGIPLKVGDNVLTIRVSAPGNSVEEYTLTVTRKADDPDRRSSALESLKLEYADTTPINALYYSFDPGTLSYMGDYMPGKALEITAVPVNANAEVVIKVNGTEYGAGGLATIPAGFAFGTVIEIIVTPDYGIPRDSTTYTVTLADGVPPTISDLENTGLTLTDVEFSFESDEAGAYYYLVRPVSDTPPDAEEIKAGAGGVMAAGTNGFTLSTAGLAEGTAYTVYLTAEDAYGNRSAILSVGVTTAIKPTAGNILPTICHTDGSGAFTFTTNLTAGKYYYAVVAGNQMSAVPSAGALKDAALGVDYGGAYTYYFAGTGDISGGTSVVLGGLLTVLPSATSPNQYTIFLVCESEAEFFSTVISRIAQTTQTSQMLSGAVRIYSEDGTTLLSDASATRPPYVTETIQAELEDTTAAAGAARTYNLYVGGVSNPTDTNNTGEFEMTTGYLGKAIRVEVSVSGYTGNKSASTALAVSKLERLAAPAGFGTVNSTEENPDGRITGLLPNTDYDIKSAGAADWSATVTTDAYGVITGLAAGAYEIRRTVDLQYYKDESYAASVFIQKTYAVKPDDAGGDAALAVDVITSDTVRELGKVTGLASGKDYVYCEYDAESGTWGEWQTLLLTAGATDWTGLYPGAYRLKYADTTDILYANHYEFTIAPAVPWKDIDITGAAAYTPDTISVGWTAPSWAGGSDITSYTVKLYKGTEIPGSDPEAWTWGTPIDTQTVTMPATAREVIYTDATVERGVMYRVEICATNAAGSSEVVSRNLPVLLLPVLAAPGADTKNSAEEDPDGVITGLIAGTKYDIMHEDDVEWTTVTAADDGDGGGEITGLQAGAYRIRLWVSLTYYAGYSDEADVFIQKTYAVTPSGNGAQFVQIDAGSDTLGMVTGLLPDMRHEFGVYDAGSGTWEWSDLPLGTTEVTDLQPGTYSVRYKESIEILYKNENIFTIDPSAPWKVSELILTPGNRTITVAWLPPEYDGGEPIEGYIITLYKGTEIKDTDISNPEDKQWDWEPAAKQMLVITETPGLSQDGDPITLYTATLFKWEWVIDEDTGIGEWAPVELEPGKEVFTSTELEELLTVEFDGLESNAMYRAGVVGFNSAGYMNDEANQMKAEAQVPTSGGGLFLISFEPGEHGSVIGGIYEFVRSGQSPWRIPGIEAHEGYVFRGWSLDGKTVVDPFSIIITENVTFYALYRGVDEYDHMAYITGFGDGTFRPDACLTRAETAVIIARIIQGTMYPAEGGSPPFNDTPPGSWFSASVGFVANAGIMIGYGDGTFRPYDYISREEFAKVIAETAIFMGLIPAVSPGQPICTDAANVSAWARDYVYTAQSGGWFAAGNLYFDPLRKITRAEAVKVVNSLLGRPPSFDCSNVEFSSYSDIHGHWAYSLIIEASINHNFSYHDGTEAWIQ